MDAITDQPIPHDTPIEDLPITTRAYNCLKNARLLNVSDIVAAGRFELSRLPGLGRKSLDEIREAIGPELWAAMPGGFPPSHQTAQTAPQTPKIHLVNLASVSTSILIAELRMRGFDVQTLTHPPAPVENGADAD